MPTVYPRAEMRPILRDTANEASSREHENYLRSLGVCPTDLGTSADIARCSIAISIWLAGRDACFLDETPFVELLLDRESRRQLLEALEVGDGHEITEALLECLADDDFEEVWFTTLCPAH